MKRFFIVLFLLLTNFLVAYAAESDLNIYKINESLITIDKNNILEYTTPRFELNKEELNILEKESPTLLDMITDHVVQKGDNLWKIARSYEVDIDTLIGANDINDINTIRPGDVIKILPIKGILHRVIPGENLSSITRKYNISMEIVTETNGISDPDKINPGRVLLLPGAKPEFAYSDRLQKRFTAPVAGKVSSLFGKRWGKMHEGIDYAVSPGTEVKAASSGVVIYSGWARGYGNTVIIEHQKGFKTLYAHNSKLMVSNGERVKRGELISLSGNTGTTTGPNMHFEVQINNRPVNPLRYLR